MQRAVSMVPAMASRAGITSQGLMRLCGKPEMGKAARRLVRTRMLPRARDFWRGLRMGGSTWMIMRLVGKRSSFAQCPTHSDETATNGAPDFWVNLKDKCGGLSTARQTMML